MSFGLSGAAVAGLAIGGATLASGYLGSKAAGKASDAQSAAALAGVDEQRRQFDALQKLLSPYTEVGAEGIAGQRNLIGLGGADAQSSAINALQQSPQFMALQQQGNNAILQNASATGGLRGGNTQAALAQFNPALLSKLIQDQYSNLGGLSSLGQNAAAGVGNAGMQTGSNIANLLQQQGAAQAGGYLGQAAGYNKILGSIGAGYGAFTGMGGKF